MDPSVRGSGHYFGSSDSLLVGSPDSYSTPRSRPVPSRRSMSSPSVPRIQGGSADQLISTSIISLRRDASKLDHQWTLFGQLMENEGQLPSPHPMSANKRPSTPRRGEHEEAFTSLTSSGSTATQRSNGDPFLDVQPVVEENEPADLDGTAWLPRRASSPQNLYSAADNAGYDSDSDLETSNTPSPSSFTPSERQTPESLLNRIPAVSILYRNVLKCSIAYFIASLFTFSPHLSSFISDLTSHGPGPHTPFPSGHMVATM